MSKRRADRVVMNIYEKKVGNKSYWVTRETAEFLPQTTNIRSRFIIDVMKWYKGFLDGNGKRNLSEGFFHPAEFLRSAIITWRLFFQEEGNFYEYADFKIRRKPLGNIWWEVIDGVKILKQEGADK